jgi:hypothetical protein
MDAVPQAILSAILNLGGYAAAALVVIHAIRKNGHRFDSGFPAAALALFFLWAVVLCWYVGTELIIAQNYAHEDSVPLWLDSSNGIAETNQSENFQVWLASLTFKYLRWPGSPESK